MFRTGNVFYGWWIVAASVGIQMIIGGLMINAYGVYVEALRDEFGWSKTLFSIGFAMSQIESGLFGPAQGWLVDRFGPRALAHVGMGIMAVGFMAFSQVSSPVTFLLAFFLIAVGSSLGGFPTVMVAVVNWFERRRSLAIGLTSTGFALGGFCVTLVLLSIEAFGWRSTAFASGIITLIAGQLLARVLVHRPESRGLVIDGGPARVEVGAPQRPTRPKQRDFTAREALRTGAFWYISLGHGAALLIVSAVTVHMVVHLDEDLGYSALVVGLTLAVLTASQLLGQIAGGILGDLINKRLICVVCMVCHVVALLMVAYALNVVMVLGFAALHGLAWGARGPLMQAIRADYFGRSSFGTINGFSSMIVMMGMTTGPLVAGILADQTGSYQSGFTVLAVMAGLGSIFFVLATPPTLPGGPVQGREREAQPPGPVRAGADL